MDFPIYKLDIETIKEGMDQKLDGEYDTYTIQLPTGDKSILNALNVMLNRLGCSMKKIAVLCDSSIGCNNYKEGNLLSFCFSSATKGYTCQGKIIGKSSGLLPTVEQDGRT